ncbi:hypothetical protein M422DRAFT_773686 [Sphaerobolus stellatus SS14]|nr:hypothetical protein M422DRAFT_773686 [Sphaerobolus stellatus SS14]
MTITLETLPVELVADILSEVDLSSLIVVSGLSRRLRSVVSDASLNPWRKAMLEALQTEDPSLMNLGVRNIVPRQNWIEVLSKARPEWILFTATLPNLRESEWEEAFSRRFLPNWKKWRREGRWRQAFLSTLSLVIHRTKTRCTADEAWTSYIIINRNGSANQLDATSRNFSPITLFNEIKLQNDLLQLDTHIRVVLQLTDVRILALGVQHQPRKSFQINLNATHLLHPPSSLQRLRYPTPSDSFVNYPDYTPSGYDKRWLTIAGLEEGGGVWVGSLMLVAQLLNRSMADPAEEELDLVLGPGHAQYASLTWLDLWAFAPWMAEKLVRCIDGPGLGLD